MINSSTIIIVRVVTSTIAFIVGIILYTIAVLVWGGYDGFPSILVQSIISVIISAIFVGISLFFGIVLQIIFKKRLRSRWQPQPIHSTIIILISLFFLVFGSNFGITSTYIDPHTYLLYQSLHPAAAIGGYVVIIFTIVNWPIKTKFINKRTKRNKIDKN